MSAPASSRRRWPWILGILTGVLVLAVVIGVLAGHLRLQTVGPAPTPTTSPTRSASPSTAEVTGCLGGTGRDTAMLLAAQKAAPHRTAGAVEVAAAFVRWTFRHPTPTAEQATQAAGQIIASTASDSFKNLAASAAANPNPSGGAVADGTDFSVSTAPGVYYVDTASADRVTASIGAGYVVDGALNPNLRSSSTFTLVWERGAWRIQSGSLDHSTEELFSIGTRFTGGC